MLIGLDQVVWGPGIGGCTIATTINRLLIPFATYAWNTGTYFWDYARAIEIAIADGEALLIQVEKTVEAGAIWTEPYNRRIVCSPDALLLSSEGEWLKASSLVPMQQRLQHFCGNGHYLEVQSVEGVGVRPLASINTEGFGTLCIPGAIIRSWNEPA